MMGSNSAYGNNPFAQLGRVTARYQNPAPTGPRQFPWAPALAANRVAAGPFPRAPLPIGIPARPGSGLDPGFGRFQDRTNLPAQLGQAAPFDPVRGAAGPVAMRRIMAERILGQLGIISPEQRQLFARWVSAQNAG